MCNFLSIYFAIFSHFFNSANGLTNTKMKQFLNFLMIMSLAVFVASCAKDNIVLIDPTEIDDTDPWHIAERIDQILWMTLADVKNLPELCAKVVHVIFLWFTFDFNHKITENQQYVQLFIHLFRYLFPFF